MLLGQRTRTRESHAHNGNYKVNSQTARFCPRTTRVKRSRTKFVGEQGQTRRVVDLGVFGVWEIPTC